MEIPGSYAVGGIALTSATAKQLRDYVQFVLELARDGKRPTVSDSNTAETSLDMLADSVLAVLARDEVLNRYHAELMAAMSEILRLRDLHDRHCCLAACDELAKRAQVPGQSPGHDPKSSEVSA
jgi:hypothetical protein